LEFGLLSSVSLGLLKNSNGLPKKSVLVLDLSLLVSASPEGVGEVSGSFSLFSTPVRSHGRKKLSPALSKSSRLRRLFCGQTGGDKQMSTSESSPKQVGV